MKIIRLLITNTGKTKKPKAGYIAANNLTAPKKITIITMPINPVNIAAIPRLYSYVQTISIIRYAVAFADLYILIVVLLARNQFLNKVLWVEVF